MLITGRGHTVDSTQTIAIDCSTERERSLAKRH
jgi:hypothetical protein